MKPQTVHCADAVGRGRHVTVLNHGHLTVIAFPPGGSATVEASEARRLHAVLLGAASSIAGRTP